MKRFTSLYYIALTALLMLTACQSDDTTELGGGLQPDGKVRARLKVGVAGSRNTTRAWADSPNAVTAEMMNVWTVVAVDNTDNKVVSIWACKPSGEPDQEIDEYVGLPGEGSYRFYSFANMSPKKVLELLGIECTTGIGTVDNYCSDNENYKVNTFHEVAFTAGATVSAATVAAKTVTVAGNNFDVTAANGFGAVGIPMSNVQTITVDADTETIELIVIRMLAKFELQIYNNGTSGIFITSVSLTDVTPNSANNLKLLPRLTTGANTMEYVHKDIKPNLGDVTPDHLTINYSAAPKEISATGHRTDDDTPDPVILTFYVNESNATNLNGSNLFYLSLGIKTTADGKVEYHHALISQEGNTTTDDDAWDYIARNDYRIIPVILTDWQFRVEPLAFVPIAGYPAQTLSSNALKATFGTGGMIALQPFVKKIGDDSWRDFGADDVAFEPYDDTEPVGSISWKNSDGVNKAGPTMIVKTAFTYDPVTKCIIGELNNDYTGTTVVTVTVELGGFTYSFTFDVILGTT